MNEELTLEYICTHLGEEDAAFKYEGAVNAPLFATSLHVFENMEGLLGHNVYDDQKKYIYGRVDNPTVVLLEKKLAAIEHAQGAVCFASGMAAITSALLYGLKPGDHLICVLNAYGPTRTFIDNNLKNFGIDCTYVQGTDIQDFTQALRPNTGMIYLESPTSAVMQLQDLEAVVKLAKEHNIVTAIDNTWAAGVYQKPLDMGVDMTVHTISKYFGGHSDVIGGVLCAREEIVRKIRDEGRELYGGIIGPFEAWLVLRSLRTLSSRLEKSSANAIEVAAYLEKQPRVRRVNYPGLKSYKQYDLAQKQMSGSSGLLSFELDADVEETIAFADRLKLFHKGVSWGGFESLACMPMYKCSEEEAARRDSSRNLIRLYCGLENAQDLLMDLERAFKG